MKTLAGYDVVVVGGGAGGAAAAIAAGRAGAKTLLLEREGFLGGGATVMLVHPFMPHLSNRRDAGGKRLPINAGIFKEVCDRLFAAGQGKDADCIHFDPEYLKVTLDEMARSAGVEVVFHAALFDAQTIRGRVESVALAHNGGPLLAAGKVFIDATGDGALAARAGAPFHVGDAQGVVMPVTTNFTVDRVDTARLDLGKLRELVKQGDRDTPALLNTNLSCLSWLTDDVVHFNAIRVACDPLDPASLSSAEMEGRRRVVNFVQWLRAKATGFENCRLQKMSSHIGIRESRRVIGDYVLTGGDVAADAAFDDAIACCSYWVDIHSQIPNQLRKGEGFGPKAYYQIPYRCLTPRHTVNLLVAGRCISADWEAHGSLRIIPPVMCIGQAAGTAGAMAAQADGDVRAIDVPALQASLRHQGAFLDPPPRESA